MQIRKQLRTSYSLAPVLRGKGWVEGQAAVMIVLLLWTTAFAQDKSLDQQLLDDLKPVPAKVKQSDKPAAKPKNELDDALKRELEGEDFGAEKKEEHPLVKLAREMKTVQERIDARDTAEGTQQKQKAIADQLAKLIEQAQKKPQGGQGNSNDPGSNSAQAGTEGGNASSRPGQQSTQRLDPGEQTQTQMNDVKDALRRIWGHLPEKEREEMIAALGEQFLPKYERLIEAFYKRLAERPARTP
jgi:hypothetical protein